jgi:hypothetical protein
MVLVNKQIGEEWRPKGEKSFPIGDPNERAQIFLYGKNGIVVPSRVFGGNLLTSK